MIKDILKLLLVAFLLYAASHAPEQHMEFLPANLPAGVQPMI